MSQVLKHISCFSHTGSCRRKYQQAAASCALAAYIFLVAWQARENVNIPSSLVRFCLVLQKASCTRASQPYHYVSLGSKLRAKSWALLSSESRRAASLADLWQAMSKERNFVTAGLRPNCLSLPISGARKAHKGRRAHDDLKSCLISSVRKPFPIPISGIPGPCFYFVALIYACSEVLHSYPKATRPDLNIQKLQFGTTLIPC